MNKALILFLLFASTALCQSQEIISSVTIQGNRRVSADTFSYYISTKRGDFYNEAKLLDDFRRLWATGFLDDLKIISDDTPEGIKITFQVVERPLIKLIEFRGNKELSKETIDEKLRDARISLQKDQPLDRQSATKAVVMLQQLLLEKGLHLGDASYTTEPLGDAGVKLTFVVDEGPKVKIGEINFDGNKVFSDGKLKKTLKETREHWMFSWISRHDDFEKEKYEKDVERVRDLYFNHGYINTRIDEPKIDLLRNKERMRITIPVQESKQFRTGDIKFTGNTVLNAQRMMPAIALKKGKVFDRSKLKKGLEDIQKMYGDEGYIYTSLAPVFDVQEDKQIVNLNIEVEENGQFYVNRMEFTGNTFTRDKVIRREMQIQEGQLLRVSKFRESLDRIYRMGFFEDIKPNIVPVEGQNKADVTIEVKENKRNQIELGGGYSETDGVFGQVMFSTANLFGTGKTFGIHLQSGTSSKNYSIQLTDPYFLDHPLSLGFALFDTRNEYTYYIQESRGGTLSLGFPLIEEFRGGVSYTHRIVAIDVPQQSIDLYPNLQQYVSNGQENRLIPQLVRSMIDNPIDPRRGLLTSFSTEIVGGFLGGDYDYIKPAASFTGYFKALSRNHYTALNIEAGYATGISGQELPLYERFYLGGEQSIRGYEQRIISPIEINADTGSPVLVGGNKFLILNAEYVIPLAGVFKLAGFVDYGNAFDDGEGFDLLDMRGSMGAELRLSIPMLNAPFRFIYAVNFNRGELMTLPESSRPKRSLLRFSVGTTF